SGLSAGITVGYIGASFPVVVSLAGSGAAFYSTIILGYTSGFLGMMLSPIHVCLIVTNEYYTTSTFKTLAGLWKPVLFVFACAALYAFLWTAFG
ncbi:MAG: DUF401 family protein, partial [Spirochaetales bacterium]|nr:DUF401 family protein [Spirochaetales bacterium]